MNPPSHPAPAPGDLTPESLREAPAAWLPRLGRLLDEQGELCARLDALSREQSGVIDGGDTDALLRILGERQAVIDRVTALNALLEPFRSARETVLPRLSGPERDSIQARVDRIAELVDGVRRRDDADRAALEAQRGSVADELSSLSRSRGALTAYAPTARAGVGPSFQDRRG